jgi:LuxR family transcriptional regulator, maltose regulon positive regulatory protein
MAGPLAKLTPPLLTRVVRRERLHRLLDAGVRAPVVWFGAAAGSGKTTIASDYLALRKGSVRWYRVDSGDLDLASFFFYLSQSVSSAKGKRALPVFGPEYAEQPVGFARRFFREYYSRLPAATTLVFDDLHVAAATLLPAIIAIAIEELPPDFQLFLLSRDQAPPTFGGFRGTGRLAIVDDSLLVFDDAEAAALIRGRIGETADASTLARLQADARGWAAGLVLLSEQATQSPTMGMSIRDEPGQLLFDYFAREVFDQMDIADRHFMQMTALLPDFTPQSAAIVACRPGAQGAIDNLYQRRLFLTRLADRGTRYQYHDLFRAFLLDRLRAEFAAAPLREIKLRAVDAALADDRVDSAIELCLDVENFERAADLLSAGARTILQQGRRETLRTWIQQLPAALLQSHPWLDYWQGVASMIDDEARATAHFERAHAGFTAAGDAAAGCLTAAQAFLAIHMSWDTHVGAIPWIKRLDQSPSSAASLMPGDRLRVSTALLRAAAMGETYRADEQAVATHVENALAMLEDRSNGIDANDRLVAADTLQEHALFTAAPALFERTVAAITPYLADRALTAWARCHWLISFGTVSGRRYPYRRTGFPYENANEALQEAWATSHREQLPNLRFAATSALINISRVLGDDGTTEALVTRLVAECNPAHPIQVNIRMGQRSAQLACKGRYAEALVDALAALEAAAQAKMPLSEWWTDWLNEAQILIGMGHCDDAAALMREHEHKFTGVYQQAIRIVAASAELWAARRDGAPDYVDRLRACMADIKAMGWVNYMTAIPLVVSEIWADALEHGIEREFIAPAIRRRRLTAPALYAPSWPWPVRVRVLGRLEIERDDVPVTLGAKAPMKPLELLKVLAAAPQHKVDVNQVQGWLWPESSDAAAKDALGVALHRLRKLLGSDEAITLSAGKLQLSAKHVWIDAAAFESWLDEAQRKLDDGREAPSASVLAERLFADYRGRLFGDDEPTAWSIGPRERLHGKFLQLVNSLGRFYEVRKDWAGARRIYERGLAQDQLAEEFYRGMIRGDIAVGELAGARRTFRRCKEVLSLVLGVAPGPDTLDLISKLPGLGN